MKDIIIIGAGGFGKEIAWLIENINLTKHMWNILGFVDDKESEGTMINGYKVIGTIDYITSYKNEINVVCAIGNPCNRKNIIEKLITNENIKFPTLIDPDIRLSKTNQIGKGSIICGGTVLTVNITIGNFVIINLDCTIGHDAIINNYTTLYPSVNLSGNTTIGNSTEIGTGSQIIQGKAIGDYVVVGAGAVIVKDIPGYCKAVGIPAKPIEYFVIGAGGHGKVITDIINANNTHTGGGGNN